MAERRVPDVVSEGDGFGQVLVGIKITSQRSGVLHHLDGMSEAGSVEVPLVDYKDLGLVLKAPERSGIDNTVAVPLKARAKGVRLLVLVMPSASRLSALAGVWS